MTLGSIAKPAVSFARDKGNLRLIESEEMADLVLERYDQIDNSTRACYRFSVSTSQRLLSRTQWVDVGE